jgi:hypothetical protein
MTQPGDRTKNLPVAVQEFRKKVVNVMGDGGDSYGASGRNARKSGDARTLAKWHGSFYAPFFLIQQGNSGSRKK